MEVKSILKEIGKQNTIYGWACRNFIDDPLMGPQILRELNEQIEAQPESMEKYLGAGMVARIKKYWETK